MVRFESPMEGVMFAAPVLIVHYIEEHSYAPPEEFLKGIEEALV
jgi:hypothetical protein